MKSSVRDMTSGSPAKLILRFSLPVMVSNAFHQLYILADSIIVSRMLGVKALAALGSADWYTFMFVSIVQALVQGFAIQAGQEFGAHRQHHLHQTLARSIVLTCAAAVLLTLFATGTLRNILFLLQTPEDVYDLAYAYLLTIFLGLGATTFLNFTSAMLRALGNAKVPLWSMIISTILNIFLDLVMVRSMGITGAALATVISQAAGGFINLYAMMHIPLLHMENADWKRNEALDENLLKLSLPMMLQNLLISGGGMIVQSRVNGFDLAHIASYSAMNKMFGLLELAAMAYGYALITYISQNFGAHKPDRIRSGLKSSAIIALITSAFVSLLIVGFGRSIAASFLTGDPKTVEEAANLTVQLLRVLAFTLPLLYLLHVMRSALQGLGNTMMPMVSGLAEIAGRLVLAVWGIRMLGWNAIVLTEPVAWIASDLVLVLSLQKALKKLA
ncbi:MAG: MATE family efflux transporter [Galactobacillus timonensis]|uniref:MATE family efflux transporter n=1 Tax=Galactobacillus timonensis TaxID=2041840 RepID=UPI0024097C1C|nr:MATE family efflux transporter [Galactobacillus timonensis]MDD6600057.1 MATE family efflux transporter [Galactobacillus timonensis]